MAIIRITKSFNFEMAHALWNYDGPCRNIHGHSYKLWVSVMGHPIDEPNHAKQGMVIDFGDLKNIVRKHIVSRFDHALIISAQTPSEELKKAKQLFDKLEIVDFQPTSENLVTHFADLLKKTFPPNITLVKLKLRETESSYAEWFADDNPKTA